MKNLVKEIIPETGKEIWTWEWCHNDKPGVSEVDPVEDYLYDPYQLQPEPPEATVGYDAYDTRYSDEFFSRSEA